MKKSVYSLVLDDQVVQAVDRFAAMQGMSRSAAINRILADYFAMSTPQERMRVIFDQLEKMVEHEEAFQLLLQPSEAMFSIRSALHYRYKPAIRYCVELYPKAQTAMGELRVSLRSQSPQLLAELDRFFHLWSALEQQNIAHRLPGGRVRCVIEDGRFTRVFMLPEESSTHHQLGLAIAGYVQMLDSLLKLYFCHLADRSFAEQQIQKSYASYLEKGMVIL